AAVKKRTDAIAAAEATLSVSERRRLYDQAKYEKRLGLTDDTVLWHSLTITEAKPRNSTSIKLAVEKDGRTVLASNAEAATDSYFVTGDTSLENVTAVMIEVLPDERLPQFGPGFNGKNFVLTEFSLIETG